MPLPAEGRAHPGTIICIRLDVNRHLRAMEVQSLLRGTWLILEIMVINHSGNDSGLLLADLPMLFLSILSKNGPHGGWRGQEETEGSCVSLQLSTQGLRSTPRFWHELETGPVHLPLFRPFLGVTGFLCVGMERPLLPTGTGLQPSHFCTCQRYKKIGVLIVSGGTEIAVSFYWVML